MALPTKAKTWLYTISAVSYLNKRITYTSLNQVMGQLAYEIKNWLVAAGYTVKGSCNGVTGAMDGVDRWASVANAQTRGATAAAAQSWIVLTGGAGINILLAYTAGSDDRYTIGMSPSGVYVAAGTPANKPTATDECLSCDGTLANASPIASTASGDRLWDGWVTADRRNFRVAVARGGVWTSCLGVEEVASAGVIVPAVTFNPSSWAFFYTKTNMAIGTVTATFTANRGGRAVATIGGTPMVMDIGGGAESVSGSVGSMNGLPAELQGGGYPLIPVNVGSLTTGARGKLGNRYDWWIGRTAASGAADGDMLGNNEFIQLGEIVWPWDGTPSVAGTAPVLT